LPRHCAASPFEGRILVIGFASRTVPQIPANHLLVKNVDVIGVNWPAYAELNPLVMTAAGQRVKSSLPSIKPNR
jgi:D-arabinose 1-dehydrogenase-like Zn-dependent alcohol dehydrogenase